MKLFNDYKKIVLDEIHLIDLRAPVEFEKGAFKNAVNLPIMDDEQRHLVGIEYKERGSEAATELGYKIVSGKNKEQKVQSWIKYMDEHQGCLIYCFRGGQRSKIAQDWIYEVTGKLIPRIEGGYKAFRNYLIDALLPENQEYIPIRLSGCTGSGKTILLNEIASSVDLEKIGNHRGSAFGPQITPQPTPINFENNLAYDIIQKQHRGWSHLIFENEGKNVGKCFLPKPFYEFLKSGSVIIIETPFEKRVEIIFDEYVNESQNDYIKVYGEFGLGKWYEYITESVNKAEKRLGGLLHRQMLELVEESYENQVKGRGKEFHKNWIKKFLEEYYDPMYLYQMDKSKDKVIFRGSKNEILEYLGRIVTGGEK